MDCCRSCSLQIRTRTDSCGWDGRTERAEVVITAPHQRLGCRPRRPAVVLHAPQVVQDRLQAKRRSRLAVLCACTDLSRAGGGERRAARTPLSLGSRGRLHERTSSLRAAHLDLGDLDLRIG